MKNRTKQWLLTLSKKCVLFSIYFLFVFSTSKFNQNSNFFLVFSRWFSSSIGSVERERPKKMAGTLIPINYKIWNSNWRSTLLKDARLFTFNSQLFFFGFPQRFSLLWRSVGWFQWKGWLQVWSKPIGKHSQKSGTGPSPKSVGPIRIGPYWHRWALWEMDAEEVLRGDSGQMEFVLHSCLGNRVGL